MRRGYTIDKRREEEDSLGIYSVSCILFNSFEAQLFQSYQQCPLYDVEGYFENEYGQRNNNE